MARPRIDLATTLVWIWLRMDTNSPGGVIPSVRRGETSLNRAPFKVFFFVLGPWGCWTTGKEV